MANEEHLKILMQGVDAWNRWRKENPEIVPDLSRADLSGTNLFGVKLIQAKLMEVYHRGVNLYGDNLTRADLSRTNLNGANLSGANLCEANLSGASLLGAHLIRTGLIYADLTRANLGRANLDEADLFGANLSGANLCNARLRFALLIETNFEKATLTNCRVYGISAWGLNLKDAVQKDLVITPDGEPTITVDNLEVAQFIYLLLYNEKIRHVIDTITSKVVLILGRFTPPERKAVLDAIKDVLRRRDYLPVIFDFEKPVSKTFVGTVSTLAHLAKFVIADFTDPKIVLQEVQHVVPIVTVPMKPLLLKGSEEPITLYDLRSSYPDRVLDTFLYDDPNDLLVSLEKEVIIPAEDKVTKLKEKVLRNY